MSADEPSPWPESARSQRLLFAAGGALLVVVALGLSGVVELGGTAIVGSSAIASALLIYGLLGWAGNWVADDSGDVENDGVGESENGAADSDDTAPADGDATEPVGDAGDQPEEAGADAGDQLEETGADADS